MTATAPYWFLCDVEVVFVQGVMPLISAARCHFIPPSLSASPFLNRLPSNALIPRGSQLADQNNYRQYGHVYVCIWIITVVPPLRERARVKRVIRTSTYPVRPRPDDAHSETHTWRSVCTLRAIMWHQRVMQGIALGSNKWSAGWWRNVRLYFRPWVSYWHNFDC